MRRFRGFTVLVTGVAVAALVAGCSSGTSETSKTSSTGNGAADSAAILKYGVNLTPNGGPQFDPIDGSKSVIPGSPQWLELIYGRLVNVGPQGQLEPGLLTSWKAVNSDTAELTVRSGVTFQDGTAFDAAALKYNWARDMAAPGLAKSSDFQQLKTMTVVSTDVLEMHFAEPILSVFFNTTLTGANLAGWPSIASPTALRKEGASYNALPVGAGPYKLTSFVPGSVISLRRWKGYWDPSAQKLAGVDFVQVASGSATTSALISGRIDAAQIDGTDVPTMSQYGLEAISAVGNEDLFLLPKANRAPLDNVQVRTAIQYALDRSSINQVAYAGKGIRTQTLFPLGSPYYSKSVAQAYPYPYDPQKAKQLLAASGVSLARPLTILLQNKPAIERAAQVVQANLEAVGFNVKLNISANALPLLTSNNQPDFFMAQTTQVADPTIWVMKDAPYNMGYDNPAFDAANTAAEGAVTTQAQASAYVKVQQILLQDSPWYAMVAAPVFVGTTKQVGGISLSNRGAYAGADLQGAYLTSK